MRLLLSAVLALLVACVSWDAALAGNAHFVGTPVITVSGNTVTATGKIAGLGDEPQVHVMLTADAQCVNPGNNKPQAANKTSVSAEDDFPVQNGKADFTLSATAVFQPNCTPPMTVEFSNVTVTFDQP